LEIEYSVDCFKKLEIFLEQIDLVLELLKVGRIMIKHKKDEKLLQLNGLEEH
jgi:hypothetical protein